MANADTPEDALAARNNGAQGIGLCRTEHMVSFSQSLLVEFFLVRRLKLHTNKNSSAV